MFLGIVEDESQIAIVREEQSKSLHDVIATTLLQPLYENTNIIATIHAKSLVVDIVGDVNITRTDLTAIPINFGTVSGSFFCSYCGLPSLKGAPKTVGGDVTCTGNNLKDLNGAPETVGGLFYCTDNKLQTLKGGPKTVGKDFRCYSQLNRREFTEDEVRSVSRVSGTIYVVG